ncbi:LysR family transcriptional regulator [Pseudoxanthomonas dokdonensis]|uniref:HTH lysR-type domain-containing protein n=1 Tax=Pseudoxanthomonas dokdonensis TaxID=344882 RepID=A0A0R0CH72_9GAMM|nr:LysR family transcriptional regulator [Pseudoxanthomonas dokdonensis]KRG68901.1 hypothetical protein ABB29_10540 [Pseudoxanthomonas dokdonensis]
MSRPLPSLNALRAFEAAARLQSVSLAAAELHVTHGAISRQVKLLEQELGLALFTRHGRGLALTSAGVQLRDASSAAFNQLQQAIAGLRPASGKRALVLGCPSSLLARWLIPRLGQLEQDLPGLPLHLVALETDLSSAHQDLDAALFLGQSPYPVGWDIHELAVETIGPVLAPELAERLHLDTSTPQALCSPALLHTTSRPQAWPSWAAGNGLDPDDFNMGNGFPHLYHLLEAASAGLGIAIAPRQLVQDELDNRRLLAPWGFTDTDGRWVLAARAAHRDRRIPALATWLSGQLQQPFRLGPDHPA